MSVQRSQASISRGQKAVYVVQVSTANGSASGVTVALTSEPTSQKPAYTSGCLKGQGTASCAVGSVQAKQPVSLKAQIPVAASASSVTSVKLTATASVVTTGKWTPPAAAETVAVTAAPASRASSPAGTSPLGITSEANLPLGPIPNLNGMASRIVGAGDASGLFPAISPADTPSPAPGSQAAAAPGQNRPSPSSSAIAFVQPGLTGQVAGLIALAVAVLLTVTRLSLRRRFRSRKQASS